MNSRYQTFNVIAAVDEQWGIGKGGLIPWHHPEDFKWFKKVTIGATLFMGRKTYEELAVIMKGKKELMPGRKSIVFSSTPIDDHRVQVCSDLTKYMDYADEDNFFIGGRSIFEFGLTVAGGAYITRIPGDHGCDVKFPETGLNDFSILMTRHLTPDLIVNVYQRVYP